MLRRKFKPIPKKFREEFEDVNAIVIFCRSIKDAKKLHWKYLKRGYNPNSNVIKIDDKGRLIIHCSISESFDFDIKLFWINYGYFPILVTRRRKFFNKKSYDKVVPNCVRFIRELIKK